MDPDDAEEDWVGFSDKSSRSDPDSPTDIDQEPPDSDTTPPADAFGLGDVSKRTQDEDPSEPSVTRQLRSALECLRQASSAAEPRDDFVRAHQHLCRALDIFDSSETDIKRGKIETAIAEIESRLQEDTDASEGPAPATTASGDQEEEAGDPPSPPGSKSSSGPGSNQDATTPDRAELIAELRRLSDQQDGVVSRGTMWSMGNFDPGDYEAAFGSWEAALEEAELLDELDETYETEPDEGPKGSADDGPKGLDLPEGRVSSLEVIVKDVDEIADAARDRALTVETPEGISLPLLLWDEHEVDYEFETNGRYLLEETRYKTWETDDGTDHQLNSTSDLVINEIGPQDWLTAVRLELHRYRLEHGDDLLRLEDFYKFCEYKIDNNFPARDNIRPKIRKNLQRLQERGEIQFVEGDGAYRIIELDGFSEARDVASDQTTVTSGEDRVEAESDPDRSGESQTDPTDDHTGEPSQIDRFMDDLDL